METKIKSVAEFVEAIIAETSKLDNDDYQIFWFRGEGSINWKTSLVPNSYRTNVGAFKGKIDDSFYSKNIKHIETNTNADFKIRAQRYISSKGIENSYWNRYILMQHYGINTRLLDWTENAILALFFAISDKSTFQDDSKVWILLPTILNDFTIKRIINTDKSCAIIPTCNDSYTKQKLQPKKGVLILGELTRRYLVMDFENASNTIPSIYYPLAILPIYLDERMNAQKTCFTIFGDRLNGLLSNDDNSKFLSSITIEGGESKLKMLKELQLLGIDFESIYPDLNGIGQSISEKYKSRFLENSDAFFHVLKSTLVKIKTNESNEEIK